MLSYQQIVYLLYLFCIYSVFIGNVIYSYEL